MNTRVLRQVEPRTLQQALDRAARPGVGRSPVGDAVDGCVGVRFLERDESASYQTYAELRRRALRVAGALRARGVATGERVALILPTGPEFYDAFFGALYAGAVPVPLYPPLRLGRLDEYHQRTATMLRAVEARLILTERRIHRILGPTVEAAKLPLGARTVTALREQGGEVADASAQPDDLAFIQFSSGTVASPKPICLTHRQVLANARRILDALVAVSPEGPNRVNAGVSWLPLYHDMGLVGCVVVAILHPGELTLIPPELFIARPALWLRALSRYLGTISPAPNFAYALCNERINDADLHGVDLSRWLCALNGAEPVTPAVLTRFVERFARWGLPATALTPVYGLAEATLAVTFSPFDQPFRLRTFDRDALAAEGRAIEVDRSAAAAQTLVSLGRALPGFELRVVAEPDEGADGGTEDGPLPRDRVVPEATLGRLLVRGPSVMLGYHGRPDESAKALAEGWLDTGDRGFIYQGELYLFGRAKDIIIQRGRNIAPQDVEQTLEGLDGVRAGCAVALGIPSDRLRSTPAGERSATEGEALVLLVERAQKADPTQDEALAVACVRRVAERSGLTMEEVQILEPGTLPRTSSGKLRRAEAQTRYLAETLTPPRAVTPLRLAGELLRSAVAHARARLRR